MQVGLIILLPLECDVHVVGNRVSTSFAPWGVSGGKRETTQLNEFLFGLYLKNQMRL